MCFCLNLFGFVGLLSVYRAGSMLYRSYKSFDGRRHKQITHSIPIHKNKFTSSRYAFRCFFFRLLSSWSLFYFGWLLGVLFSFDADVTIESRVTEFCCRKYFVYKICGMSLLICITGLEKIRLCVRMKKKKTQETKNRDPK